MEDLIDDTECVVTITNSGYIKRLPLIPIAPSAVAAWRERRQTQGDDDFVSVVSAHQTTSTCCSLPPWQGRWLKVYEVPAANRTSRGKALANVLDLAEGEQISATIPLREFPEDNYLFMATARVVKKCCCPPLVAPAPRGLSPSP